MKIKKSGFTLVEILMTLAIIGLVAVLTIPSLMGNYQKVTYVSQLQKTLNSVQNAFENIKLDENASELKDSSFTSKNSNEEDSILTEEFFKKYFKTTKICKDSTVGECYGNSYKGFENDGSHPTLTDGMVKACAILNTGSTICINPYNNSNLHGNNIAIDVNGPKGPNIWGRDAFFMHYNSNGDIDDLDEKFDTSGLVRPENCWTAAQSVSYATGCFRRIVLDGWKMNY